MHYAFAIGHAVLRGTCAALLLAGSVPSAHANWLAKLARGAGEAGELAGARQVGRLGIVGLDRAAAHIKALPAAPKTAVLAAHATPEGHWKFVNRDGDVFTAGTPDELKRAVPTLLPDAAPDTGLAIYLSEETVFGDRALLKDLPSGASLHVVAGGDSYPLVRRAGDGGQNALFAKVRPNLDVELREQALFDEAVAQLERPLSRASIRTLALEPGGPATLSSSPRLDPSSKEALVDVIDPPMLPDALRSVRGQTVLVTGRVENNLLSFRPASGGEQTLKILDAIRAAADADVNLVILNAAVPRQPGGRNWLWQRISVGGLDEALKRATLGDFLDAIAAARGGFRVGMQREGSGRVSIRAMAAEADAQPITGVVGEWVSSAASNITGNVLTDAVEVHARGEERQKELDRRIIPHIPSWYQFAYLAGLIGGILGWPIASEWFARIWPQEQREEYQGAIGFRAAQGARLLACLLLFLPIAGIPALIVSFVMQVWTVVTWPVRAFRWLSARANAQAG